jgi:excisionase family DNA binding protein
MSIDEVGDVLRISERSVYRLLRSGELPSLKVGQRTLVEPQELRHFIANRRRLVAASTEG